MTKKEQQQAAYEEWSKDRTPDNMSKLLNSLESTINSVSATHGAAHDENLKWALKLHLASDLKNRYDPSKSAIQTFVYQSLRRAPRLVASQKNLVHVPESSDSDIRRIRATKQELFDIHEREPTLDELADRSGVSQQRIKALDDKFGRPTMAISKFHLNSGGVDPMGGVDVPMTAVEELYKEYSIEALDKTDRKIYDMLSKSTPMAKSQIASNLGISPPAVSQRVAGILDKLDLNA